MDRAAGSSATSLAVSAGLGTAACLWLAGRWLAYHHNMRKARDLPQLRQFLSYYSIVLRFFPSLAKHNYDLYKKLPRIFAEMQTPLIAFVSSENVSILINDATLFREVCVTKRRSFPKAVHLYDTLRVFGENIVTTEGEVWKRHRAVATRSFTEANNRLVFETTIASVGDMMAAWERQRAARPAGEPLLVTVVEDVTQMTLCVITAASFGSKIHATYGPERHHRQQQQQQQQEEEADDARGARAGSDAAMEGGSGKYRLSFTRCMEVVSRSTVPKVLLPAWAFYLPLGNLREIGTAFKEFNEHLLNVVDHERKVQRRRRQQQQGEGDGKAVADTQDDRANPRRRAESLFSLLVQANNQPAPEEERTETAASAPAPASASAPAPAPSSTPMVTLALGKQKRLDLKELLGNAFIFLLAGHETSSHALSFALLLLALHPEEQEAVHSEVAAVLGDGPSARLRYEDLDRLVLCHGTMNEALRLFPPVPVVPKVAKEAAVLVSDEGRRFPIPKGAIVNLQVYALHRNSKHFPDPEAFRPQRWDPSSPGHVEVGHFAFAPFSLGERSCIGRRFGQITILASLAMLVHRYRLSVPEGVDRAKLLEFDNLLTLCPSHDAQLVLTPRSSSSSSSG